MCFYEKEKLFLAFLKQIANAHNYSKTLLKKLHNFIKGGIKCADHQLFSGQPDPRV